MRTSRVIVLLIALATLACLIPMSWGTRTGHELLMTVWGMPFEDRLFRDIYARGFERLHTNVRVNCERYIDVMAKYQAWHVVGRGADVMRIPVTGYRPLVDTGALEPLNRFIADPVVGLSQEEIADFFPAVWQAIQVDDEVYALPSDQAQYGLFFNRTIFDKYDADRPNAPLGYPNAEWTWNDLKRATDALSVQGSAG